MSRPGEEERAAGNHSAGGAALTISSELMVAAVIFLFMVVVFVFFLYLYAKHYMTSSSSRRRGGRRGAHFIFPASELPPNHHRRGLDAQVLRALPVTVFRPADFKDGLECAVCLAELSEGEKLRQLPECNHGFHVDCIDMWFQSHSTCPLCRSSVGMNSDSGTELAAEGAEPLEAEASPVFPTNVLFWGTHDRVNNMRGLAVAGEANTCTPPAHQSSLVIEIPRRAVAVEGFPSPMTPLPSSRFPAEEMKSPKGGSGSGSSSGASATFKSLKRLLSQGKRAIESSWSPRGGDIEEGLGGGTASGEGSSSLGPKTPTSS